MRYFKNLRWYRLAKRHLMYTIAGHVIERVYVIDSFNYCTGKIRMRGLQARPGDSWTEEFNASRIKPVSFKNLMPEKWYLTLF